MDRRIDGGCNAQGGSATPGSDPHVAGQTLFLADPFLRQDPFSTEPGLGYRFLST